MKYEDFIIQKGELTQQNGFDVDVEAIHPLLFDFQKSITAWAVKNGKACIFAATGLGKTLMQIEYARIITEKAGCKALIVAPLAVSSQTIREARKINVEITDMRREKKCDRIGIINYDRLSHVKSEEYDCIVLDESSILKNYAGKTKNEIIEMFAHCKYKLACTATPAPNDFMELGNHSEFIDVMKRKEMLSMFFIHDSGETATWRLKGHAQDVFWRWVASWAAVLTSPSDLGFDDGNFKLPPIKYHSHSVKTDSVIDGHLFAVEAKTLNERRAARRDGVMPCVEIAKQIIYSNPDRIYSIWCNLNCEADAIKRAIPEAVEIRGSDDIDYKESTMLNFADGKIRVLVTKPRIAGFGMNWQVCHNTIFFGLSDSFEQYFQAIRRHWRFGQKHPVNVHILHTDIEGAVIKNIERKELQANLMHSAIVSHTRKYVTENIAPRHKQKTIQPTLATELPAFLTQGRAL